MPVFPQDLPGFTFVCDLLSIFIKLHDLHVFFHEEGHHIQTYDDDDDQCSDVADLDNRLRIGVDQCGRQCQSLGDGRHNRAHGCTHNNDAANVLRGQPHGSQRSDSQYPNNGGSCDSISQQGACNDQRQNDADHQRPGGFAELGLQRSHHGLHGPETHLCFRINTAENGQADDPRQPVYAIDQRTAPGRWLINTSENQRKDACQYKRHLHVSSDLRYLLAQNDSQHHADRYQNCDHTFSPVIILFVSFSST